MAYAPHTNTDVQQQLRMGQNPTALPLLLGSFRHKEANAFFEYAERRWGNDFAPQMPHIIFVHGLNGSDTRLAHVCKTVAHVVVGEDDYGKPRLERWPIKQHRSYPTDWVKEKSSGR